MSAPLQPLRPRGKFTAGPEDDVWSDVGTAQGYLERGVQGYGESLRPQLLQDVGSTLGGLNAIGGLRSGGVPVALGDISGKYGAQIGAYAKQASAEGVQAGLEAHRQRFEEAEAKRRRKAALLGAIGSVLGAGIGFAAGGPLGAGIGSKLGSKAIPGSGVAVAGAE
jgi:hypothetical protein